MIQIDAYSSDPLNPGKRMGKPHTRQHDAHQLHQQRDLRRYHPSEA